MEGVVPDYRSPWTMPSLSRRDLGALLELVRDLHDQSSGALPGYCVSAVRALIGAEVATCSDFDLRASIALETTDPPGLVTPSGQDAFERHLHEHPLIAHYARTGDGRAFKSSDFLSQSQLRRLGLYNEYIKPFFHTHYQIAFAVTAQRSRVVGLSLAQAGRDFSERDRLMLNVLRPHLGQALRHAGTAASLLGEEMAGASRGLRRQVIVTDRQGRIRETTAIADQWLRQFFGRPSAHRLPDPVWRWVAAQVRARDSLDGARTASETLVARQESARLMLRCVIRERGLFVTLECVDAHARARRLAALGLTAREVEVLKWIAEGKATSVIATIVGSSVRTVDKHLERIYRKLGVENPTAAALVMVTLDRESH